MAQVALSRIIPSLKQADRATLIGCSGSGKTTLAEYILRFFPYVVVLDTKGFIDWPGYKLYKARKVSSFLKTAKRDNDAKVFKQLVNAPENKIIFRPSAKWLRDDAQIEQFFQWIYWRENCVLYVDEATSITTSTYIPDSFFDCIVRGREKGIQVFTSTQRPSGIKPELLTETEHVYCFRLRNGADKEKVRILCGIDPDTISQKHEFIYSDDGEIVFDSPRKLNIKE